MAFAIRDKIAAFIDSSKRNQYLERSDFNS